MERIFIRLAITIAALLTAAFVVVIALGFLGLACYLALLERLTPPMAALATAGAALLLAVLIFLIGRAIGALVKPRAARRGAGGGLAGELGTFLGAEFGTRLTARPYQTLIALLVSGFALGASPNLRRLLRDFFFKR
jgi:hypothetical protein